MSGGQIVCVLAPLMVGVMGAWKVAETAGWHPAPSIGTVLGAMAGFVGLLLYWTKATFMQGEIGLASLPLAICVGAPVGGLIGLVIGFGISRMRR